MAKRSADKLAERLRELQPAPVNAEGGLPLCREGEPLEVTLRRIKAAAVDAFGPDVDCRYRPGKAT